jgi:hypothetical protein
MITSVMDGPALRFPNSGTSLAHWNGPQQHPRGFVSLDLQMASQSSQRRVTGWLVFRGRQSRVFWSTVREAGFTARWIGFVNSGRHS